MPGPGSDEGIGHVRAAGDLARLPAAGGRARRAFLPELARVDALYLERLMATHDAPEGIAAWVEKRVPLWKDA
jgi:hypothetical protein